MGIPLTAIEEGERSPPLARELTVEEVMARSGERIESGPACAVAAEAGLLAEEETPRRTESIPEFELISEEEEGWG